MPSSLLLNAHNSPATVGRRWAQLTIAPVRTPRGTAPYAIGRSSAAAPVSLRTGEGTQLIGRATT